MLLSILRLWGIVPAFVAVLALAGCGGFLPSSSSLRAKLPLKTEIINKLEAMGSSPGAAMVIRIIKDTSELEVWKRTAAGTFKLFKTYEICAYSGTFGPKIKEGDRQAPEGFYNVTPGLMNPNSNYYLAFNTGFPNKFDRAWGRTGSDLMVHGACSSRGCYSMTDESIAEIYALVRESFAGGNDAVQLQIFPFRLTPQKLARYSTHPHLDFWFNLKEGYDRFELSKTPPKWDVCERKYVFDLGGEALDAAGICPTRVNDPLGDSIAKKIADDRAAYEAEVASIRAREDKAIADRVAAESGAAAAAARGEAIGDFIGGLFGPAATPADPGPAPQPLQPPSRP